MRTFRFMMAGLVSAAAPVIAQAGDSVQVRVAPSTVIRVAAEGQQMEAGIDMQAFRGLDPPGPLASTGEEVKKARQDLEELRLALSQREEILRMIEKATGEAAAALKEGAIGGGPMLRDALASLRDEIPELQRHHVKLVELRETILKIKEVVDRAIVEAPGRPPGAAEAQDGGEGLQGLEKALEAAAKRAHRLEREVSLVWDQVTAARLSPGESPASPVELVSPACRLATVKACDPPGDSLVSGVIGDVDVMRREIVELKRMADEIDGRVVAHPELAKNPGLVDTRGRWRGLQLIARATSVRDPETGRSELSAATTRVGGRVELTYVGGRAGGPIVDEIEEAGPATLRDGWALFRMAGIGGFADWKLEKFAFQPLGGEKTSELRHDFKAGMNVWLFSPISGARQVTSRRGESAGKPDGFKTTGYGFWLWSPQLRVSYGRAWKAADELILVDLDATPQDGVVTAERRRVAGPGVVPELSVLAAVPFEPRRVPIAFGPALQFRSSGVAGGWQPSGGGRTTRGEFWLYYYGKPGGKESATTVRVGLAPYVQHGVRAAMGAPVRETVFGLMLELRSGTLRLQY